MAAVPGESAGGWFRKRHQHAGVLVEFSVSLVVLWLIVAATLDLGRAFAAAHVLQSAARAAARELALQEVPYEDDFREALLTVFDPAYLVVDADCLERYAANSGRTPEAELVEILRARQLTLNLMLRPLMMFEHVAVGGTEYHLLRYPGALLSAASSDTNGKRCSTPFTVGIAQVDDGQSRVTLHSVVEEIDPGAFSLAAGSAGALPAGTVGLRLLYPFQAAGLSAWRVVDGFQKPVPAAEASDYQVDLEGGLVASPLAGLDARGSDGELQAYAVRGHGEPIPIYGGSLGLGVQSVLGREVRPYRRLLSAQAIAAREVIGGT